MIKIFGLKILTIKEYNQLCDELLYYKYLYIITNYHIPPFKSFCKKYTENNKKKKKVKKMANLYKMAEKYRFDVPKSGHFVIEKKDANKGQKKRGDKK